MIVFAILATIGALIWSAVTIFANGMKTVRGEFTGGFLLIVVWGVVAVLWIAWWADQPERLCSTAAGICF